MKPVLVFVPGMLCDERLCVPLISATSEFDLQIADTRQHKSIEEMANAAWQLILSLPAEREIVLCGFSMGGYVVLNMLSDMRRPIEAAVLISTSARAATEDEKANRRKAIEYIGSNFPKMLEHLAAVGFSQPTPATGKCIVDMGMHIGPEIAIQQCRAIMDRPDVRSMLGRISIPVHVLCGENDRLTPQHLSEEMASLIPGACLQIVPDAGHMLPLEKTEAFKKLINKVFMEKKTTKTRMETL